jgi:hypothetical protein
MAVLLTAPSAAPDLGDAFGNQIGEAIEIFIVQHRPQFSPSVMTRSVRCNFSVMLFVPLPNLVEK